MINEVRFKDKVISTDTFAQEEESKVAQLIARISGGRVKTERQASVILWIIFILVVILILTSIIAWSGRIPEPLYEESIMGENGEAINN